MMMSKPTPEGAAEGAPAFATKPAAPSDKKADAVQDLEKRLAMLGGTTSLQAPPPAMPSTAMAPQVAVAPPAAADAPPAAVKGGQNALLVRREIPKVC